MTAPLYLQRLGIGGLTFSWVPPVVDRSAQGGLPGRVFHDLLIQRYGRTVYKGILDTDLSGNQILIDFPYPGPYSPNSSADYHFYLRTCLQPQSSAGDIGQAKCGSWGGTSFSSNPPVPPNAATVTVPASNQVFTDSTVTFRWQPVGDASAYQVRIQRGSETVLQLRVPAPNTSTVYSLGSGDYTIDVSSCTVICSPGAVSVPFRVTLPPVPTGAPTVTQATITSGNALAAGWSAVPGADIYRVQVVQPNTGPGGGALTVASGQTATTNLNLSVPAGPAAVFVAACNGNGCGPYSNPFNISPAGPSPSSPILGTPIPGTSVNGPTTLFTWSRIPGDTGANTTYRLYVADLGRSATAADVHTTNNFAAVQLASEGRRFDAVVAARPGAGQIVGPPTGFQILGTSPGAPTPVAPGHQSTLKAGVAQIGWTPVTNAYLYEYYVTIPPKGAGTSRFVAGGIAPGTFTQLYLPPGDYSLIVRACTGNYGGEYCLPGGTAGWGPWSNEAGGPGVTNFTVVP
ncbi:MAG: hypothetical protein U0Q16_15085 [Bryobacteraceae bacterium]